MSPGPDSGKARGVSGLEESYVTGLMQQIKLLELENTYLKSHPSQSHISERQGAMFEFAAISDKDGGLSGKHKVP